MRERRPSAALISTRIAHSSLGGVAVRPGPTTASVGSQRMGQGAGNLTLQLSVTRSRTLMEMAVWMPWFCFEEARGVDLEDVTCSYSTGPTAASNSPLRANL